MGIRNYTSGMEPAKTAAKIQQLLASHDARRVSIEYGGNGGPQAVVFEMEVHGRPMQFRLEPNVEGMERAMEGDDDTPNTYCNEAQARRTAWKNRYDWLHAQLAEVASNQAEIEELFLGFGVTDDGRTLYERLEDEHHLLQPPEAERLPASRQPH